MSVKKFREGLGLDPQSSDPGAPFEGQLQFADGTARAEGLWVYQNSLWVQIGTSAVTTTGRNRVVNGDFYVNQRTNAVQTNTVTGYDYFGPDRFRFSRVSSGVASTTFTNVTETLPTFTGDNLTTTSYATMDIPINTTTVTVSQRIPANNMEDIAILLKKISIGAKVNSTVDCDVQFRLYTYADYEGYSASVITRADTGVISLTGGTDMTQLSVENITGTNRMFNGVILEIAFNNFAAGSGTINIGEMQLIDSPALTAFNLYTGGRDTELDLCRKYFRTYQNTFAQASATTAVLTAYGLYPQMHSTPILNTMNVITGVLGGGLQVVKPTLFGSAPASFTTSSTILNSSNVYAIITGYTGLTTGDAYTVGHTQSNAVVMTLEAEL